MKRFLTIMLCVFLMGCAKGVVKPTLDTVPPPIPNIEVPNIDKPPHIDLQGMVNIPQGKWTNEKGNKFTVGQGGGAFFPKKALETLKYQIRLNEIALEKLFESVDGLDNKIQREIKASIPSKIEKPEPGWFNGILGGK